MSRKLENLRNIGIIAHIDAGKTTVTERMLYYAKASHKMGDVDKGTTITDFDPEEQERGITIYSASVSFQWKDVTVNLIDTPGHVDFTAEVERSLRVLDGGVVVFSAREGVEAQSETVWRQADKYHVPRMAFINKLDREGADFHGTLDEIRDRLGSKPVAIQIPWGLGPPHLANPFRGVVDLVGMRLLTFTSETQGAEVVESDIPAELHDEAELWREQMLEQLFDYSNELAELVLEKSPVPVELIRKVLREATLHRFIVPVLGVFYGTSLIADEVDDKTITYLFTRPIPRRAVLFGKYVAYLFCTVLLILPSVVVVYLLLASIGGTLGAAFPALLADLTMLAIGLAAYGAVFAFVGARMKRPLVTGLVFAFGWEPAVLLFPGYLKRLTVAYYLQALVPQAMPDDSAISILMQVFHEVPPVWVSLASLAAIVFAALWAAGRSVETREYVLEQ